MKARAMVELVLAAVAAVGCVVCWAAAGHSAMAPPILPGEPSKAVEVYSAPLLVLALLLAAIAGVLAVLGVARLRRR